MRANSNCFIYHNQYHGLLEDDHAVETGPGVSGGGEVLEDDECLSSHFVALLEGDLVYLTILREDEEQRELQIYELATHKYPHD